VVTIQTPIIVDGPGGRLYAPAAVGTDGRPAVVALSARDGRVLTLYDISGPFAFDAGQGWLYVDRGNAGLAVVDAANGAIVRTIALPFSVRSVQTPAAPVADAATPGRVLALRGPDVLVVDAAAGRIEHTISYDVRQEDRCRMMDDPRLPIDAARLDAGRRLLYLNFTTYVCTPWIGHTIFAYDFERGVLLDRQEGLLAQTAIGAGVAFGWSWQRMGNGSVWAMRDGQADRRISGWSGGPTLAPQIDERRKRVYQPVAGGLAVFDSETLGLLMLLPAPAPGALAGFDATSDQLIYLHEGRLAFVPAGNLAQAAQPLTPAVPPAAAVHQIGVSPGWKEDQTLFGVWRKRSTTDAYYLFAASGGELYGSRSGGRQWSRPASALPAGAPIISDVALSPNYGRDRTLLISAVGAGAFRSNDGGALWTPASAGLGDVHLEQVAFSPGFAVDRTLFALPANEALHRSTSAGDHWEIIRTARYVTMFALSPEFDRDATILIATWAEGDNPPRVLQVSRDAGATWQTQGALPDAPVLLSAAPAFARWGVAFLYAGNGRLYRSADAGRTWQVCLDAGLDESYAAQLVYGPGETNRPLFFLAAAFDSITGQSRAPGRLFRSRDGGLGWEALRLPDGVSPTALAISPAFTEDGLIFVGTDDGRVLTLRGLDLPAMR
jgi:photosystem II stability/assembly factor-like uncharacterized protein